MKSALPKSTLFIAGLLALTARAAEESSVSPCFEGPLPAYLVALRDSGLTVSEAHLSIQSACTDMLDARFQKSRPWDRALDAWGSFLGRPVLQEIPSLVHEMLGDDETMRAYRVRLSEVARIRDRYQRIRETFELAVSAQGAESEGFHLFSTPRITLNRARTQGSGGACRDFSKLLEWSLMQVNRSPSLPEDMRRWGALDEDSFFVRTVGAANHEWVEVLIPVGSGDSQVFHRMHLDSTHYRRYVPLFPRNAGLSDARRGSFLTQCMKVWSCLEKAAKDPIRPPASAEAAP